MNERLGFAQQLLVAHALTHDNLMNQTDGDLFDLNPLYDQLSQAATDADYLKAAREILAKYGFSAEYVEKLEDAQLLGLRTPGNLNVFQAVDFGIEEYPTQSCRDALAALVNQAIQIERPVTS